MPKLAENAVPAYRRHKQSGQAVVTLNGRDILLGPHGTPASRAEYRRRIAEWIANGRMLPQESPDLTISELLKVFRSHCLQTYGEESTEIDNMGIALRPLRQLYGSTAAADFGPLKLEAVRNAMIDLKWVRTNINRNVARIKMLFKWAVSRELIPAAVHQALTTLPGLKFGRSDAKESAPVTPVDDAIVDATIQHLTPTVAAMVQIQRLTGARPGEICNLRIGDIDRGAQPADPAAPVVWPAKLREHKTRHHGRERTIYIGPKAQAVILPYLRKLDPTAFVFSPIESERERHEQAHEKRVQTGTPLSCGNVPGSNRSRTPRRAPGESYDTCSYRRAIARACDDAFPPPPELARGKRPWKGAKQAMRAETKREWRERLGPEKWAALQAWHDAHSWHPHQLRHTAATDIRRQFGIEAAQHVLGHASLSMTEIYAERNADVAQRVAAAIG